MLYRYHLIILTLIFNLKRGKYKTQWGGQLLRILQTGVTADRTGANLPATAYQGGNWTFWETSDFNLAPP